MKPNNLYYRQKASKLTGETYSKLYSSSYYARKIAEHYNGEEYTGRKPLNKYLEDWYVGLTGETAPTEHKPNLWYLRRLAKATDDSINEKTLNENQCLHIIADGDDWYYYREEASTETIISRYSKLAEYEVYPSDKWNWHYIALHDGTGWKSIATLSTSYDNSSSAPIKTTNFPPQNNWTSLQVKIENGTVYILNGETVKGSTSISFVPEQIRISNSKSNTQQRNVKIK